MTNRSLEILLGLEWADDFWCTHECASIDPALTLLSQRSAVQWKEHDPWTGGQKRIKLRKDCLDGAVVFVSKVRMRSCIVWFG